MKTSTPQLWTGWNATSAWIVLLSLECCLVCTPSVRHACSVTLTSTAAGIVGWRNFRKELRDSGPWPTKATCRTTKKASTRCGNAWPVLPVPCCQNQCGDRSGKRTRHFRAQLAGKKLNFRQTASTDSVMISECRNSRNGWKTCAKGNRNLIRSKRGGQNCARLQNAEGWMGTKCPVNAGFIRMRNSNWRALIAVQPSASLVWRKNTPNTRPLTCTPAWNSSGKRIDAMKQTGWTVKTAVPESVRDVATCASKRLRSHLVWPLNPFSLRRPQIECLANGTSQECVPDQSMPLCCHGTLLLDTDFFLYCFRETLTSLCTAMTARSTQLHRMSDTLHSKERDILTQETQLLQRIREASEEAMQAIREEERKLVLELKDRCNTGATVLKNMKRQSDLSRENIDSIRDYGSTVLSGTMSPDMMSSYQDLITQMDFVLEESLMLGAADVNLTSLQFIRSKSKLKLGKLKHEEQKSSNITVNDTVPSLGRSSNNAQSGSLLGAKPRRKSRSELPETITLSSQAQIQPISSFGKHGTRPGEFNSPGDVCFLPSNDRTPNDSFVVADTNNNRLQVFNIHGTFIKVIGEGQIKPWGVAVTQALNIVVSDTLDKCIKIYSMEGLCLQKFGKFLCPCGIAVNSDGHFVVTDFFSASVYTIDVTGKALQKFDFRNDSDPHMSGRSHISVTKNDTLVISDMSNSSIKVFNKSGQRLHQILCQDIQMSSTSGICTDHLGNILVADTLGSQITVLSKKGRVISHLDFKSGIRSFCFSNKKDELGFNGDPTGIAVSQKGNLVLTYSKSNQVHVYKIVNKQYALHLQVTQLDVQPENNSENCPLQNVQF